MGTKQYRFSHALGRDVAIRRVEPVVADLVKQYGLAREDHGPGKFRLHRSGVEASIAVNDADVVVDVELGWVLEKTVRGTLEDALNRKIAPLLV